MILRKATLLGASRVISGMSNHGRPLASTIKHMKDGRRFSSSDEGSVPSKSSAQAAPNYDIVYAGDHGSFKEYSVIFTNRSLNLMATPFQTVMKDLNALLKYTYNADKVAIVPGSGTFGMEVRFRLLYFTSYSFELRAFDDFVVSCGIAEPEIKVVRRNAFFFRISSLYSL